MCTNVPGPTTDRCEHREDKPVGVPVDSWWGTVTHQSVVLFPLAELACA